METSFQEFGAVSERRRNYLELCRRRRNVRIVGAVSVLLLVAIFGAVCALYSPEKDAATQSRAAGGGSMDQFHTTGKSVETLCASTDYKQTCVSSLNKAAKNATDPTYLVKAAVFVLLDEAGAALNRTRLLADKDPKLRGAVEDCRQLFEDSKDEIKRALESIAADGIEQIPVKSHDIRTWLSSVLSYQQTCIDGFPEGELKVKLQKAQNTLKEMTSNSLAIIGQLSDFFEMLDVPGLEVGGGRKLLEDNGGEGFPSWVLEENRRILKEMEIKLKPNVTVAKDGSGDYKTISEALLKIPTKYHGRYNIYVKAGVYEEAVNVTKKMVNVTIYGDGATDTIVTGDKNFVDGVRTFMTATFAVSGDGFMGINIGIRNTAGAIKHQAVALRVQSDHSVFFHCRFEGYQDTLYAQAKRQFYRSCVISGTVDFIFGDSASVFQNCLIVLRRPLDNQQNIVLAHGRVDRRETTGFVLHKCKIIADQSLVPDQTNIRSYLGRPWKQFARHIIMESEITGAIVPAGYMPWEGDFGLNTLFYGEADNTGPGAEFAGRVKWPGVRLLKKTTAERYTVARFIQGDEWINAKRGVTIPVRYGLYN